MRITIFFNEKPPATMQDSIRRVLLRQGLRNLARILWKMLKVAIFCIISNEIMKSIRKDIEDGDNRDNRRRNIPIRNNPREYIQYSRSLIWSAPNCIVRSDTIFTRYDFPRMRMK